jgi:hypothetical protein
VSGPHALPGVVRQALRRRSELGERFLDLLERRLRGLEALAAGARTADLAIAAQDRALARRFLRSRAGSWDDGDEDLVRGWLDGWQEPAGDRRAGAARALLAGAAELANLQARPATLWFFLWEMESMLAGL